jgi:hypothetical protein
LFTERIFIERRNLSDGSKAVVGSRSGNGHPRRRLEADTCSGPWALLQYPNGETLELPRSVYVAFRHLPPFDDLPLVDTLVGTTSHGAPNA